MEKKKLTSRPWPSNLSVPVSTMRNACVVTLSVFGGLIQ